MFTFTNKVFLVNEIKLGISQLAASYKLTHFLKDLPSDFKLRNLDLHLKLDGLRRQNKLKFIKVGCTDCTLSFSHYLLYLLLI